MKRFTLIFLLLFASKNLLGEDISFKIIGNKRTKNSYIKTLVFDCHERLHLTSVSSLSDEQIEQCLLDSRIFADVSAKKIKNTIYIKVKERWTLIPIPMMSTGSDSSSAGLFLMESNFLGLGKKAGVGGSISSEGSSYFVMYKDPGIMHSRFSGKMIVANSTEEVLAYDEELKVYGYKLKTQVYEAAFGRELFPFLHVSLGAGTFKKSYSELEGFLAPKDYTATYLEPEMSYSDQKFKFYFNEGALVHLSYNHQIERDDSLSKARSLTSAIGYDKLMFKNHALQFLMTNHSFWKNTLKDTEFKGGGRGTRGLRRSSLWVKDLTTFSLDYQIPIKEKEHGTWTLAPFADYGIVDSILPEQKMESYFSYGVGAYLFMKQIALPGVGIVVGKNSEEKDPFFSVSIGMRMR